jgi:hypothetical protein
MTPRIITTAAVTGLLLALSAGDLLAAGRGNGGKGSGAGGRNASSATCPTGTTATARPAGSQRRDGTFLSTGTTANGATTRPGNGNGLQDGSRLTTTTTAAPAAAQ